MTVSIKPLDGPMGALVEGLDTRRQPSDAEFSTIYNAMVEHFAIVIPQLDEDVAWLRDFGRRFGPLVPHILEQYHHPVSYEVSIIARNTGTEESRDTAKPAGAYWHSDLSYEKAPADAILLYASQVPSRGGDTVAANMALAYDRLPEKIKQRISGLYATHRFGWNADGAAPKLTEQQSASHPDVVHPVVRVHPQSRRKTLYVSPGYTVRIEGISQVESDNLLAELFEYATDPEIQYRHKWKQGMLLGVDNRATMHFAVDDYDEPRRLLRMLVGCTESELIAA
jgi:taurine dioxygenase